MVRLFIAGFFAYELLYILGAFSTRYFFILAESHRAISLALITVLTLLLKPGRREGGRPWFDWVMMAIGAAGCLYVAPTSRVVELQLGAASISGFELALGVATIAVMLEATRRVSGLALPVMLLASILYAVFANRFPGPFYGRAHPFDEVIAELYLSFNGLFGSVMGLWTTVLVVFLLFGGFLQATGAGDFFIRLALAVAGRLKGGPAKVAVVSSGLFGMISGSAAADCATTGVVTIPLMIRSGYTPVFAGAVEAVAATGGPLMPPVMGMTAFMMAEFLDISYLQVCIAAAIPALLYYGTLFAMVDLEARKSSLAGLPVAELPSLASTLRAGWFYLVPVAVLIAMLAVWRYPPGTSAIYALAALAVVTAFRANTRLTPARTMAALEAAAQSAVVVAIICGSVGILIAALAVSGATLRSAVLLTGLSGGSLFVLLTLAGLAALVLGTGLPAVACYTLLAVSVAPALVDLGVPPIGAHLFVLYWGLSNFITPPVGGSLYIASSLSGVGVWRQGFYATMLGMPVFVVPFLFCYHVELLGMGSPPQIVWQSVLAGAAMWLVAAAFVGYSGGRATVVERVLLLAAAVGFVVQGLAGLLTGALLTAGVLARQWLSASAARARATS